jgi:flagellar biosynthesis/type III secretory pathway protein FliH
MTIAEQLHKQGRKKGLEQGIKRGLKKGREEGRIATLRSLLIFKFQTLGAEYEARLQAATPEAIDRYLQRLLTADSLAKVFKD